MNEEAFYDMTWRIDLLSGDKDCLEEYPELKLRFEGLMLDSIKVCENITNDQLIRYIIYAYHLKSPFVRRTTDVKQRKQQAIIKSGYDLRGGIAEDVREVLDGKNPKVSDMTLRFLQGENSMKFAALMMQVDAYYKYNFDLAYGEVKNIKSHTQALSDLEQNIESLSHVVFSGDVGLADNVSGAKMRGLILTPEMYASKNKK